MVGAFYPLFRFAPALYGWGMRRRIFRLYGELSSSKGIWNGAIPRKGRAISPSQLEWLEGRANHLQVPLAYTNLLYNLRRDIQLVRERLAARRGPQAR